MNFDAGRCTELQARPEVSIVNGSFKTRARPRAGSDEPIQNTPSAVFSNSGRPNIADQRPRDPDETEPIRDRDPSTQPLPGGKLGRATKRGRWSS